MTNRLTRLLLVCCLGLAPAFAGEISDPATAQVPKDAKVVVRIPSLDRIDQAAVQLKPVIQLFEGQKGPWGALGKKPPSELILAGFALGAGVTVDRTKPIYLAFVDDDDPLFILPSGGGVAWEGEKTLETGQLAVLRGDRICVGRPGDVRSEARGETTPMTGGDVCVHVYLGEVVDENREDIENAFTEMKQGLNNLPVPIPANAQTALRDCMDMARNAVFSVQSFDYALVLNEGRLESEGLLKTSPRSDLRNFLAGAGAPQENDLALLLPQDLFMAVDGVANPAFLMKDLAAMMEAKLGEGSSKALSALFFPTDLLKDVMTGRSATGVSMQGMMGGESISISELTDPAKAKELLSGFDPAAGNKALADLGIPIAISFTKAADSHGETDIHRMAMSSDNPQLGMFMMGAQSNVAVEGNYLVMASGMSSAAAIKKALDRIRSGEKAANPHQAAMERLAKKRHWGFSINLGALKPMLQMMLPMMAGPNGAEAMAYLNAFPDKFYMSTAIDFGDGNIHWRGDWPLKELTELTKKVAEIALEKKAKEELEEDFD